MYPETSITSVPLINVVFNMCVFLFVCKLTTICYQMITIRLHKRKRPWSCSQLFHIFSIFCSSSAVSMVVSAMEMSTVSMVSWSLKLWPVNQSKSNLVIHMRPGLWVRARNVIPFSPAISSVLSSVAFILSSIPYIFFSISSVFDAIQRPPLMLSVSHIFSSISHIFPAISNVFPTVSDVLSAVSTMSGCWLCSQFNRC